MCIFKVVEKGEHDVSAFNFEAKYPLFFFFSFFLSDHLSLMEKVSWTVNGLVLHSGVKQKKKQNCH